MGPGPGPGPGQASLSSQGSFLPPLSPSPAPGSENWEEVTLRQVEGQTPNPAPGTHAAGTHDLKAQSCLHHPRVLAKASRAGSVGGGPWAPRQHNAGFPNSGETPTSEFIQISQMKSAGSPDLITESFIRWSLIICAIKDCGCRSEEAAVAQPPLGARPRSWEHKLLVSYRSARHRSRCRGLLPWPAVSCGVLWGLHSGGVLCPSPSPGPRAPGRGCGGSWGGGGGALRGFSSGALRPSSLCQ